MSEEKPPNLRHWGQRLTYKNASELTAETEYGGTVTNVKKKRVPVRCLTVWCIIKCKAIQTNVTVAVSIVNEYLNKQW